MRTLTTTLIAGLMFATPVVAKDSYDFSQHNFAVKLNGVKVTYRDHDGIDKWMTQIDTKVAGVGYAYRYQESKGDVEHRARVNLPKLIKIGGFSVAPRVEYRAFDKESKDDFANLWLRFQYQAKVGDAKAYIKVQPKLAFGRDGYNGGEFYTAQNLVGIDYKVGNGVSVGVYIEQNTDADWKVKDEYLGTNISYKF